MQRPVQGAIAPAVLTFGVGDAVRTSAGDVPAERLRPGDRICNDRGGHGGPVLWVSIGQNPRQTPLMGRKVLVMVSDSPRGSPPTLAPYRGRVSRQTGKLELEGTPLPECGRSRWVH